MTYPEFEKDPHPALNASLRIDLQTFDIRFTDFRGSPITRGNPGRPRPAPRRRGEGTGRGPSFHTLRQRHAAAHESLT